MVGGSAACVHPDVRSHIHRICSRLEFSPIRDAVTIRRRLAERRVTLELTDAARASIAQSAYDPVYGARPLKRFIQHEVETRVGRALLSGEILPGATITVDVVGGELDVRWENAAEQPQAPTEEVGAPA
jgi:hypothetical protein